MKKILAYGGLILLFLLLQCSFFCTSQSGRCCAESSDYIDSIDCHYQWQS